MSVGQHDDPHPDIVARIRPTVGTVRPPFEEGSVRDVLNPAFVDPGLDSRAITFENPTGARGAGGTAHGGRKGAPNRRIHAGERVVLADIAGRGVLRHLWMTFLPAPPEQARSLVLEVFYGDATEPSVSVPALDFFGLPHGRPVAFASALTAAQEGRGFNAYLPMPFRDGVRVELHNAADRGTTLYFQLDYTLEADVPDELGYLHVAFRRAEPDDDARGLHDRRRPRRARAASSAATSACACSTRATGTARAR